MQSTDRRKRIERATRTQSLLHHLNPKRLLLQKAVINCSRVLENTIKESERRSSGSNLTPDHRSSGSASRTCYSRQEGGMAAAADVRLPSLGTGWRVSLAVAGGTGKKRRKEEGEEQQRGRGTTLARVKRGKRDGYRTSYSLLINCRRSARRRQQHRKFLLLLLMMMVATMIEKKGCWCPPSRLPCWQSCLPCSTSPACVARHSLCRWRQSTPASAAGIRGKLVLISRHSFPSFPAALAFHR